MSGTCNLGLHSDNHSGTFFLLPRNIPLRKTQFVGTKLCSKLALHLRTIRVIVFGLGPQQPQHLRVWMIRSSRPWVVEQCCIPELRSDTTSRFSSGLIAPYITNSIESQLCRWTSSACSVFPTHRCHGVQCYICY